MARCILVTDDNVDSVTIMRSILQGQGYDVVVARSGAEALECVRTNPVELVLLDIMMPEMSGIEVLQHIKEDQATAHLPVIMVTAKANDDDVMAGYQYGADYYITKPFTPKQLLYGVNLILGKGESVE